MPAQLSAKQQIVRDAFARIAKRTVELPPIVSSPTAWEYRSRLTLAMRWRHGAWVMGLHSHDDVDHVFDLRECPITDPRVVVGVGRRPEGGTLPASYRRVAGNGSTGGDGAGTGGRGW